MKLFLEEKGDLHPKLDRQKLNKNNFLHPSDNCVYTLYMQCCIPRKNDYILITEDIVSSAGCQKLEFLSKKYPNFHSRLTSFTLKKYEWYQIGSIYTVKSNLYMSLRIQRIKASRQWMKKRIKEETDKISLIYDESDDQPVLKNRTIECLSVDLNKKCFVFSNLQETLQTRSLINFNDSKKFKRWENIELL